MNFHDENRGRWPFFGDTLGDPNEQEQKKCPEEYENERDPKEKPPRIDDPRPTGEPSEILPHAFPVECPPRTLPDSVGERRMTKVADLPDADVVVLRKEERAGKARKRRRGSARFGGYLVMSASLLTAFLLMIGVLCLWPGEGEIPEVLPETDDGTPAQKVVYVNHYGDAEHALSTPELYDRCISSVVSISVQNGQSSGIGSGFVLREDGYIATAYHVVADMTRVEVILADESRYEAQVVGGDALTDLALLKIEATGLSPVTLGSSASLLPGERVVAIGTPASLDYAGSVSSGEVSYCLRTVKIYGEGGHTLEKKMKLIQTNAPVNPGNSGCPLFDSRGEVVGMVTMKLGNQFAGMGFAIPTDGALGILEAMRTGETLTDEMLAAVSVRAAKLGIVGEAYETDGVFGVRVTDFSEQGGAAEVLVRGDLIISLGDRAVTRPSDIEEVLLGYEPGDTVSVSVLRNGQRLRFDVILRSDGNIVKK